MIIQTSNEPIVMTFSEDVTDYSFRITLWDGTKKIKEWTNETLLIENDTITASLTQEETANFPNSVLELEIKWLDEDGMTQFAPKYGIVICQRNDKQVMEV